MIYTPACLSIFLYKNDLNLFFLKFVLITYGVMGLSGKWFLQLSTLCAFARTLCVLIGHLKAAF